MKPHGMSLIELMFALAVGSFLIAGAVTVYARCNAAYATNETLARLQENARFALNTIEADVLLAGFWGLTSDGRTIRGAIGNAPMTLNTRASRCGPLFALDLARPVDGTNNTYTLPCTANGGAQAGSDTLITRHAEPAATTASDNRVQIYTTRDGDKNTLFIANAAPGPLISDPVLGPAAEVHDLSVRAYYISRNSTGQTNLPSLRRKTLEGGPANGPDVGDEELMSGVEDLQVQFGIDPGEDLDGDGKPDHFTGGVARYVNPQDPALTDSTVLTARIWVRVRAETPEPGYVDDKTYRYADIEFTPVGSDTSLRRLVLSRTLYLRNATGLRP